MTATAERTGLDALTPRERQVLRLRAQGVPVKAIARQLGISKWTAHRHAEAVLVKLGVGTIIEAAVLAAREGWL